MKLPSRGGSSSTVSYTHLDVYKRQSLEVSQVARTIARNLGLNEDLTEAIAMGHDLGHTPFGHNGEMVLDSILSLIHIFRQQYRLESQSA